ncbi:integrase [Paenibacillus sp. D9]|uniref:IS21 family transposase n=1 Tax=Paenibacillus sp. D9 TaxID=665792 RepID=UPI0006200417|nr:IS21 family transposase [Paenibacillus sp. D9]KKC45812.1 integrase [Paenibacillus sp. D9]KKC46113.1 integrase [Paenibacillus sp. D9]KKC47747.1 integrase [Paenibacillus sp. D9]
MLKGGSVLRLHEMKLNGKKIREIVRETGHARNTVRKYVRDGQIPESKEREKRGSKLDPFKETIDRWMKEDGLFNCQAMLMRLKEKGYTGGATIIKDYVQQKRPPWQSKATVRYETLPGDQAQVDWGFCETVDANGRAHKLPVFVMVLGYSRATYVEYTRRCDIHSFLRCFVHAIEHFGGVPKIMLTDHMKTVVTGMNDDRTPQWNRMFEDFALSVGLTPKLCKVRRPETKGKVERGVQFVKDNFWPGRTYTDIADLNRQAIQWCHQVDQRIHGTTGERPCDRLKDENLLPLPSPDRLTKFLRVERTVSLDGFVSFDGVRYGVHWRYSGQVVLVRQVGMHVEIWHQGERIATHEKSNLWTGMVRLPGQYEGLKAAEGALKPKPLAREVSTPVVEERPLEQYEALAVMS